MTITTHSAEAITAFRRWAVLISITLATMQYAMAILVVSVVLPQMQGSLSATQDEIAWVMTFNILATAVITPMSGWLAARFGRRQVMLGSMAGFTVATLFCGIAPNLPFLVLFRIAQGAFGAPLIPIGQAIILDTFPKHQHGVATSVFGMAVVVGPVIGPIWGGWLAEDYGWPAAFFMFLPFGVIALAGLYLFLTDKSKPSDVTLDWTGFLSLSVAVICLQLLLSRGQRNDWFESPEIIIETVLAFIAFHVFVVHSLTAHRPFLEPRLLLDRNFLIGLIIVLIYGMLNFTPMVLLPPLLQSLLDEASAVYHMLRNLGSAVFISLSVTVVIISTAENYAGMTEFISDFNKILSLPWSLGAWDTGSNPSLAALSSEMGRQAALIGYINAFKAYTIASLAVLPLIALVRIPKI